jgi:hypothetical protein
MREWALVRLSLRELSYLPWVALGGAMLTLLGLSGVVPVTAGGVAPSHATPTGDAAGWALAGMFPAALWGGMVASGPSSVMHLLARPISRVRIIAVRLLVTVVVLAACGLLVVVAGRSLTIHDMVPLSVSEQAVMLCYAVASGAVARCLRADEPFAVGVAVLLLAFSSVGVWLVTSFAGVSLARSFQTLGWATLPVCALVFVTAVAPLLRHWARFVPLEGRWVLGQCAGAYLGVLVLHSLVIWYPVAVSATLPANASPTAVLGRAPDGRLWLATGERPAWAANVAPSKRSRVSTTVDGLLLVDEHGETRVTGWFGGADWLGLGHPGEVMELSAAPDGRAVAVITRSDDAGHLELYGVDGLLARCSRPRANRSGQRLRWAPDGRALVDVVATAQALDVLLLRLEGPTTTVSHALVPAEQGALLGFGGAHVWLRRDGEAIGLDPDGRIAATVELALPMARLAPFGGHLASYDPEGIAVELSRLESPSRPPLRLELPRATTKLRSLVWLDADHVAILLALPTEEHQSRMMVFHVGGERIADVPSDDYRLDELYGPPSGPWIRRGGTELSVIDPHGHRGWRQELPTITDDMLPTSVVYDRNGVRYVDHQGVVRERAYPWWGGR